RDLWRHNKSCRGGAGFPWVRAQLALRVSVPCPAHLRGRSSTPALDPLAPLNPLIRGPRTPGLRRWIQSRALLIPSYSSSRFPLGFLSRTEPGLTRSCRGAFRSPVSISSPTPLFPSPTFPRAGYSVDELEDHITQLHEYNDIKDVGQMLMGKL
uniref:DNA repair protein SWI5 homolog n=1 Tax=Rhinopithecus bieti TaxID=61621 RepID=A0A2K6N5A9_RHIBE